MTSVKDFGAFVEILPGKDGLCHISELSDGYVNSVADVCKVGDAMQVKVIAIDDQDRVKLSRKAVHARAGRAATAMRPRSNSSQRRRSWIELFGLTKLRDCWLDPQRRHNRQSPVSSALPLP